MTQIAFEAGDHVMGYTKVPYFKVHNTEVVGEGRSLIRMYEHLIYI